MLLEAMIDSGGESRLERWFLRLVRQAGIERPTLQKTFRDGTTAPSPESTLSSPAVSSSKSRVTAPTPVAAKFRATNSDAPS
jgi:hypothetical protein